MFEMLVGYPPFCSETPHETYRKIMGWKTEFQIPDEAQHLSPEAQDLLKQYCCRL
jgi:protein-serine/threonine kinase